LSAGTPWCLPALFGSAIVRISVITTATADGPGGPVGPVPGVAEDGSGQPFYVSAEPAGLYSPDHLGDARAHVCS
jgi:hypothetical protein